MAKPFEQLASLDRTVHEPARLAILTALAVCKRADFLYLQRLTALSKGNLSSHLAKLEQAGLIDIEKQFVERIPSTRVRITPEGRRVIERHWKQLEAARDHALRWDPSEEPDPST